MQAYGRNRATLVVRVVFVFLVVLFIWCLRSSVSWRPDFLSNVLILDKSGESVFKMIEDEVIQNIKNDRSLALDVWMNSGKLRHDNSILVQYVKENYILQGDGQPYNLSSKKSNPSEGQIQSVWDIIKDVEYPFFVDCGAHDGEYLSNSLWLEKEQGWNGLLIEASPDTFSRLRNKHRQVWQANVCLSTTTTPRKLTFYRNTKDSGAGNGFNKQEKYNVTEGIELQCFPLATLLLALEKTTIDFFSLDIEGAELDVLKTIPFDDILIKTWSIEHNHVPGGPAALKEFMTRHDYTLFKTLSAPHTKDSVFVHNSVLAPYYDKIQ